MGEAGDDLVLRPPWTTFPVRLPADDRVATGSPSLYLIVRRESREVSGRSASFVWRSFSGKRSPRSYSSFAKLEVRLATYWSAEIYSAVSLTLVPESRRLIINPE